MAKILSFIVCAFVLLNTSCTQTIDEVAEVDIEGINEIDIDTQTGETSDLICTICSCADRNVNCVNRNISEPFKTSEWEGLKITDPTTVDLSSNPMRSVTHIAKLPVTILNMSNCEIATIEDASFRYLENLTTLDLSRNRISTNVLSIRTFIGRVIPGTTPKFFKNLKYISLAHNDIHSLPQDLFTFTTELTHLDLSGNPLAYIDQVTLGALSNLITLEDLKISGCELETLPDGLLRRQRRLRSIDLSDNRFTAIPVILQEATKLVYLNFDKNPIITLDSETAKITLSNLQELSLNRLSKLQNITKGALSGMSNLIILRLSHNPRLTTIDPYFLMSTDEDEEEHWPLIKELYMNNNNISTINSHMLDHWNGLVVGDFSNNPYACDCKNQWMVDVLVPLIRNMPTNETLGNMVCKKPADVRGLTFEQLASTSKTLVCPESENVVEFPVSNMAIILGIMIGIMVTFPMVLVLVLLWRKGYFQKCRNTKNEYYDDETEDL